MALDLKEHWENVYKTKSPKEVSWTQKSQEVSIFLLAKLNLPKTIKIIDVGGGDSTLVDELLASGYTNITVLDISEEALKKAKLRLGKTADNVTWIVADINKFEPLEVYDVWHDRAVFHFLTSVYAQERYLEMTEKFVSKNLIIGTFSKKGPNRCSGLEVQQYSEETMQLFFKPSFKQVLSQSHNHITPFKTIQNFVFGVLEKQK